MKKGLFLFLGFLFLQNAMAIENPKPCAEDYIDDSDLFKKDDKAIFINAEFLYWTLAYKAKEFAFMYNDIANPAGQTNTYGRGTYQKAQLDYCPGFRVSAGWFNAPKYWQVLAQFTWMKIDGSDFVQSKEATNPLVGTFPQANVLGTAAGNQLISAASNVHSKYYLLDFLVTRVFVTNPHLRLKIFGGITMTEIEHTWKIKYSDNLNNTENILNHWEFLAIGFRAGLDFDWFWTRHFYFTGKTGFAPLVGKYDYDGKINVNFLNDYFQDMKYDDYKGACNLQALLGISYQRCFPNNRIEIFAGYELNGWFNIYEILRPQGAATASSASLRTEQSLIHNDSMYLFNGLTTRFTLDF